VTEIATKDKKKIMHKSGEIIEMPYPMNTYYTHSVPSEYSKALADEWWISLTFREIEEEEESYYDSLCTYPKINGF